MVHLQKRVGELCTWLQTAGDGVDSAALERYVGFLDACGKEASKLRTGSHGFYAQLAQIDLSVSAFYWMYRAKVILNIFPVLSQ